MIPRAVNHVEDDTVLVLEFFWPLLEKLFRSSHMENASLSAAACRSLSVAVHSSGTCVDFSKMFKQKTFRLS